MWKKSPRSCADVRVGSPVRRVVRKKAQCRDRYSRPNHSGEAFDGVVLSVSQRFQALATARRRVAQRATPALAAVRYQSNRVVLHTDAALLPRARQRMVRLELPGNVDDPFGSSVRWQSRISSTSSSHCRAATPVIVTLESAGRAPDASCVLQEFEYSHPLLDNAAIAARDGIAQLQGERNTWYAGACLQYGFQRNTDWYRPMRVADGIALGVSTEDRATSTIRASRPDTAQLTE